MADSEESTTPAGEYSSWLDDVQAAIRGERGSDVPCDGCTACCTSSQFVHVGPDEADTLAHIPAALLFPAPRRPAGHVLLGYDERGHCPMLVDGACSIYEHRPRACRTYDCRVLPAAGLAGDGDKVLIRRRAERWRFTFTPPGREQHEAVRAAAAYLDEHRGLLPAAVAPQDQTQLAVLAIEVHDAFLGAKTCGPGPGRIGPIPASCEPRSSSAGPPAMSPAVSDEPEAPTSGSAAARRPPSGTSATPPPPP